MRCKQINLVWFGVKSSILSQPAVVKGNRNTILSINCSCVRTSLGSREIKSRWNCGSITCIMCFTCVGSQLSINSSSASNFSGPLQSYHNRKQAPR
uniref:Uncharacterized protein n=1 Tax=Astyanax mexicanus TaxID=7994 RepID=A0A3B1INX3_ASTMX